MLVASINNVNVTFSIHIMLRQKAVHGHMRKLLDIIIQAKVTQEDALCFIS